MTTKPFKKMQHVRKYYDSIIYDEWRQAVFLRDGYACQCCGNKNQVTAHHIKPWAKYPKLRFDVDNGLTLCFKCHKILHELMGTAAFIGYDTYKLFEEVRKKLPPGDMALCGDEYLTAEGTKAFYEEILTRKNTKIRGLHDAYKEALSKSGSRYCTTVCALWDHKGKKCDSMQGEEGCRVTRYLAWLLNDNLFN